jgi:hypothetical protein
MPTICPKCDVALIILRFQDVEVDLCESCRGLWLDAGELESLLAGAGATAYDPFLEFQHQPGTPPAGSRHLCPRCDELLREITVSRAGKAALTLEKCPRGHGLWFDAEELNDLLAAFPAGCGAGKTVQRLSEIFGAKAGN